MNRRISLELNPVDRTQVWTKKEKKTVSCVYFHVLQTTSQKKFHIVVVHGKEMYQKACYICKICRLTFKTICFLTWCSRCYHHRPLPRFIDVRKLLGIRMRLLVWRLYECLWNDPNTFNKISPESWIRNIYESSSVTVAPTQTVQWYPRLLYVQMCDSLTAICYIIFNRWRSLRWRWCIK